MTRSEELKQAEAALEVALLALGEAKRELDIWEDYDLTRGDGSVRQDEMHDQKGKNLRHAVYSAEQTAEAWNRAIASLADAC